MVSAAASAAPALTATTTVLAAVTRVGHHGLRVILLVLVLPPWLSNLHSPTDCVDSVCTPHGLCMILGLRADFTQKLH